MAKCLRSRWLANTGNPKVRFHCTYSNHLLMSTERTGAALVDALNVLVGPTGNGHDFPPLLIRVPPLYHTASSLKVVSSCIPSLPPSPLLIKKVPYHITRSDSNNIRFCQSFNNCATLDTWKSILSHKTIASIYIHCWWWPPHLEVNGKYSITATWLYIGPPCSDVPTTVELVAGDDGLGPTGENRKSITLSEWDLSASGICWPQAILTCKVKVSFI